MGTSTPPRPLYLEWRSPAALRRHVACTWTGGPAAGSDDEPVLPDGCMDIIWDGVRLFVAGPDTGPVRDVHEGTFSVGLRFRPGMAPLFLGPPAVELCDARVDLDLLWRDAGEMSERLAASSSPAEARTVLEEAVTGRLSGIPRPDGVVEAAARTWRSDPAGIRVSSLAKEAGISDRQLQRRFVNAVGYGPKLLHRVLRFQAFLAQSTTPGLGLADLAHLCGYADQAHLTRETACLAARTPAELRAARRPDVRNLQDLD
jgi:AraC-like DNA-binding protein